MASALKRPSSAWVLAVALAAYVVCDVLLTPVARVETRPVSGVTSIGLATLGMLFVGLALAIVSLVLLFRRSRRTSTVAIVAAVLIFPAVIADQTGHFSSFRPPAAIGAIELVQAAAALIVIGAALLTSRR